MRLFSNIFPNTTETLREISEGEELRLLQQSNKKSLREMQESIYDVLRNEEQRQAMIAEKHFVQSNFYKWNLVDPKEQSFAEQLAL